GETADAGDHDAAADVAQRIARHRAQLGNDPTVAGRVDIGDVLPGGQQCDLGCVQSAVGDLGQYGHDGSPSFPTRNGCAKAADMCVDADGALVCKATVLSVP